MKPKGKEMKGNESIGIAKDNKMIITKVIDAPKELVFDAFIDPKNIGEWWGPDGFKITTEKMDIRPGGLWVFVMHGPDGKDYNNKVRYLKIEKPSLLMYEHGDRGMPGYFETTINFEWEKSMTKVTLTAAMASKKELEEKIKSVNALEGGKQTLGRLSQHVEEKAKEREIIIVRDFDAPLDLLWDAWTKKEHIEKWFGPKDFDTTVEKQEFWEGGRAIYVMHGPDGKDYPSEGTYKEIIEKELIMSTDEFGEDFKKTTDINLPEGMVVAAFFESLGKKSRLTIRIIHPNAKEKKKHAEMGVIAGWNSSFEKLDELLVKLRKN